MKDLLYVHIDAINNSVLSKGITADDFYQSIKTPPKNLLLLSDVTDDGEYESHTGFRIIREPQVDNFLKQYHKKQATGLKWIDFSDLQLVKQLTPIEISELLYFGHMNTHLHSPFFYKLQNNYVFLNVNEQVNKIYYRRMDVFYQILAQKLQHKMYLNLMAKQKGFFKKHIEVSEINLELIKQMRPFLEEGIVFHFRTIYMQDSSCIVPIYLVEDKLRSIDEMTYTRDKLIANLRYSQKNHNWHLDLLR